MTEMCHCGRPLHYTDPKVEYLVRKMVAKFGAHVAVVVDGHTYLVPRHYIALHGLKAEELPTLGFEEVERC